MTPARHAARVPTAGLRATGLALLIALCAALPRAEASEPRTIRHPGGESRRDARSDYPLEVLQLALDRAGLRHRLRPVAASMPQARSLRMIEHDQLDVFWTTPDRTRLQQLRVVPTPIDGGLIGWRLLLVRPREERRFAALRDIRELAPLRFAQGHDWPDVGILRNNGLRVSASPSYDGLFAMLGRGHTDAVPRGLSEVDAELRDHAQWSIALESHLALYYPSGLFFFVRRDDTALAEALERGLQLSLADGSLQRLFQVHYGAAIARARLPSRRVLALRNPELPPDLVARLWFRPDLAPEPAP